MEVRASQNLPGQTVDTFYKAGQCLNDAHVCVLQLIRDGRQLILAPGFGCVDGGEVTQPTPQLGQDKRNVL